MNLLSKYNKGIQKVCCRKSLTKSHKVGPDKLEFFSIAHFLNAFCICCEIYDLLFERKYFLKNINLKFQRKKFFIFCYTR